uniref:Uncharacterized protein n=1 Tax=Tanacetum cinerariifolium TaxID=118510 RepID=A0A699J295_TANCI|nr:hypothetical protein [Tanacetum cinerariifolium]
MDQDDAVVLKDDKEEDKKVADAVKNVDEAKVDESAQNQGRQAESQAEIYKIDMDHANKVLSMQEDETKLTKVQEVVDVVNTTKLIIEVVTSASETATATSAIVTTTEAQVPAATLTDAPARIAAAPSRRRKRVTEAQASNDMIMYLKNVTGVKMDYFKGMSYDDICLIFEAKFNSNVGFLLKTKEQIKEDENKVLQKLNETPAERAAKRRKLDEEVIEMNNKPYYKIIRADDTFQFKGQRMEATGIMWCADHNVYIYSADFVSGEEVPTHKIHSRLDAECCKAGVSFGVDDAMDMKKNMLSV